MPRPLLGSTSGCFAWRWCYWGAVVLIFLWATWLRFFLPLEPLTDKDTWTYLSPALGKLIGGGFGHVPYGRSFVYPGFVYFLLRFLRDFRAIAIVQHLLGLFAGGLLLLTWRRARIFLSDPKLPPGGYDALGLLAVAAFLLASGPIHFEMKLRPEALGVFLVSVNLYAITCFGVYCFIENRPTAAVAYGIMSVLSALLMADVKPSFVFVSIISMFPVALFFFMRRSIWQKAALGCGTALSVVLLLVPEHFFSRSDPVSRWYLPTQLFVIHANLIRDQIGDDLKTDTALPYSQDWLARVHSELSNEIAKSGVHYSTLGLNPDYLMYDPTSIVAKLRKAFGENFSTLSEFCWFYYWRIWLHRPLLVMKKIIRQFAIFYAPICPAYSREGSWMLANEYRSGVTALSREPQRKVWELYQPAVLFMNRAETLAQDAPVVRHPRLVRLMLSILAGMYLTLFLSALALSLLVLTQKRRRRQLAGLALLVLFVYSYNAASCFEVAVVHTLQNPRYVTVQMFFTILAQFLALWFLVEFILERRHRLKTLPSGTKIA